MDLFSQIGKVCSVLLIYRDGSGDLLEPSGWKLGAAHRVPLFGALNHLARDFSKYLVRVIKLIFRSSKDLPQRNALLERLLYERRKVFDFA